MPNFDFFKNLLFPQSIPPEVSETPVSDITPAPNNKLALQGRGMFIWRLLSCEGADVHAIINKCKTHNIDWLAVKCGDQGSPWKQFDSKLVNACKNAGIPLIGWSYDVPQKIQRQVDVYKRIYDLGADGCMLDCEAEWSRGPNWSSTAREFGDKLITQINDPSFIIMDAPWDVPKYHQKFPFEEFGKFVDYRCCQCYHIAHKMSVKASWDRYIKSWAALEQKMDPNSIKPHLTAGSVWDTATGDEIKLFEFLAKTSGFPGVVHWVWDSCTPSCWEFFKNNKF